MYSSVIHCAASVKRVDIRRNFKFVKVTDVRKVIIEGNSNEHINSTSPEARQFLGAACLQWYRRSSAQPVLEAG